MAHEFIYQAYKLKRIYPPDKTVLENISLSFYPGAKIGVLGSNGAGKSSLLKIMAGLDDGLPGRSPADRRVHRRVPGTGAAARSRQGRQGQRHGRRRRSPVRSSTNTTRSWPSGPTPTPTTTRSASSRRCSKTRSPPPTPGRSNATSRSPWTRCAARPTTPTSTCCRAVSGVASRCVASCSRARPAAARRADQPPRRRVGRLARAIPRRLRRHRRRHHPRPLLPRQRRQVDPRTRARQGSAVRGQLLVVARAEAGAPRARRARQRRPQADPRPRARVGPHGPEGPPGQGQGAPHRLREAACRGQGGRVAGLLAPDHDPSRPPSRRPGDRGREPAQGLRRQAAHRRPVVHVAARRHRRHHRPERRRQVDAVQDARRSRSARLRARSRSATPST